MLVSDIIRKYPEKIPIVIRNNDLLSKNKFIIHKHKTVGQFMVIIRQYCKLSDSQAVYLVFNNKLAPISKVLYELYNEYKNEDGILYGDLTIENTFG